MNLSNHYDPRELAKALIGLSLPDTPSGPFRNRRSLFVQKDDTPSITQPSSELDSISSNPHLFSPAISTRLRHTSKLSSASDSSLITKATPSLTHTPNPVSRAESGCVTRTPPIKRSFSRLSNCTYTGSGKNKSSKLLDSDSKKRRVSFHPAHEVTEYRESAQTDPYLLPLNDTLNQNPNPLTDTIIPSHGNSADFLPVFSAHEREDPDPDLPADLIKNSVLFEIYPEDGEDLDDGSVSGLLVPEEIKEQLAKLITSNRAQKHGTRKSVVTEYAALCTPTKVSPVKCKLSFPPLSLDSSHPTLKCPRKKVPKQPVTIKLSIEREDAFIPTSFFKNWYTKSTHNSFLPAATCQWLQDYSKDLIDHFLKLVRARCENRKLDGNGNYLVTHHDLVAVMREYLELDESININNLINTYLPMELWFTYLP